MTIVSIKLYLKYARDGGFQRYSGEYKISRGNQEWSWYYHLADLAQRVVNAVAESNVRNPEYRIRFIQGNHPRKICDTYCPHFGHAPHEWYTRKPDKRVRPRLLELLEDKIAAARKRVSDEERKSKEFDRDLRKLFAKYP